MGRRERRQGQFLYDFDLDNVIQPDHLVRQINDMLDLSWVHCKLAPYYFHTGRLSFDPELMLRMSVIGCVFAVRSERRICANVQDNLAYRWFCRFGGEDAILNHSAFSRLRHERFREDGVLRRLFEGEVATGIAAELVGGKAFSIYPSLIRADIDRMKRVPGNAPSNWPKPEAASGAVHDYLAALDATRLTEDGNAFLT